MSCALARHNYRTKLNLVNFTYNFIFLRETFHICSILQQKIYKYIKLNKNSKK